jgi:selenocysteine-specific elongation factor
VRTVATAGHVDHGKSSLVLALTGTDPDRFAEEKARGLTIDLGFAFTTLPSGTAIAFVDVPGHVRFLKNMLAGVGAVDVALLVVGADDGWMPQSEEHLRLLELLGVGHGVVALTKRDLVDADTLELAQLEVAERLAASTWRDAPVVVCDSVSGSGLAELREALDRVLADAPVAADHHRPRLWVDRSFAPRGAGTVVTGTLAGGSVRTGDELVLARTGARVRVRGIESGHRSAERATPGARVALNLVGIEHRAIARGDALVRAGDWVLGRVVDVALTPEPGVEMPTRARLLAYAGSGEHHVAVRALGDDRRHARVAFEEPVALAPGDHLIVRDPGRERTLGGATVLDVDPGRDTREAPGRLALPLGERLVATRPWRALDTLGPLTGLDGAEQGVLVDRLVASGAAARLGGWLVATTELTRLRAEATERVAAHRRDQPNAAGLELATLAHALGVDVGRTRLVLDGIEELAVDREVVVEHAHAASGASSDAGAELLAALDATPFAPPDAVVASADPALVRALVRDGALVDVDGILFTRRALDDTARIVCDALAVRGTVTVGDVRDLLSTTRKYAVPLLEHLDRVGITRRRGDERVAGPAAQL